MKTGNTLKWHGGKSYLAKQIISLVPAHTHYVEPFFGGGAVLFAKPPEMIEGHSEVVNDIYGELTTFWRVLQGDDTFPEFLRVVQAIPFSEPEWQGSLSVNQGGAVCDAVRFFVRYRQSRQGVGKSFATLSRRRTRRGMNEQAAAWLSAVEGLPSAHERLRRVVILSADATYLIGREDCSTTFFYCDPPYLHETRTARKCYTHEMSRSDHETLLGVLSMVQGKFLLSGYRSQLYDDFAAKHGWQRVDIAVDNKASGSATKPIKTECLWANYTIAKG